MGTVFSSKVSYIRLGLLLRLGELFRHRLAVRDEAAASALCTHGVGIGRVGGRAPNGAPVRPVQVSAPRQRVLR